MRLSLKCIGSGRKLEFFALKFLADQRRRVYFGPLMEGIGAHSPDIFSFSNFLVTREIVDFCQKFGIFWFPNGRAVNL